jgi:hypothetical protein
MRILVLACLGLLFLFSLARVHALTFEDSGVAYETLETMHFKVRYEPGDRAAAEDVATALEACYDRITHDLGFKPEGKTLVELYTTPRLYEQYEKPASWAIGGKIYPEENMMVFPSPSAWGKANIHRYEDLWHVMPHEYTHLLLRRHSLPMWLDEGIAVYEAGQWNEGYQRLLGEALEEAGLLPLRELEDFNAFVENGALSYAESYTAIAYMKDAHGDQALRELLRGVASGLGFEDALQAATGKNMDEFEEEWLRYLEGTLELGREAGVFGSAVRVETITAAPARETSLTLDNAASAEPKGVGNSAFPSPWLIAGLVVLSHALYAHLKCIISNCGN